MEIIFAIGVLVLAALPLLMKLRNSSSVVVTGPGVLKTHDVECRFWSGSEHARINHGKLSQSRWSDGQERFSLRLHKLPTHSGKIDLYRGDALVSEFESAGTKLDFSWKGQSSEDIPQFEIGEELAIVVGDARLVGVVEPD